MRSVKHALAHQRNREFTLNPEFRYSAPHREILSNGSRFAFVVAFWEFALQSGKPLAGQGALSTQTRHIRLALRGIGEMSGNDKMSHVTTQSKCLLSVSAGWNARSRSGQAPWALTPLPRPPYFFLALDLSDFCCFFFLSVFFGDLSPIVPVRLDRPFSPAFILDSSNPRRLRRPSGGWAISEPGAQLFRPPPDISFRI